jgi:hypothetical protein
MGLASLRTGNNSYAVEEDEILKNLDPNMANVLTEAIVKSKVLTEGRIAGGEVAWLDVTSGSYSFTVHNQLPDAVKNVTCQVVFHGQNGDVIGTDRVRYEGIIGAGLGQKVNSKVDSSIEALATAGASLVTTNRVEVRVLDFETAP